LGPFVAVVLACLPILLARASSPGLLEDTDTRVLLTVIRQRQDPLSWFTGDWPLSNHFYRPISTLFFELDNRLYGSNAAGYGLTNALLCVACVLLLFWFLRELTDRPLVAGAGGVLVGLWRVGYHNSFAQLATVLAIVAGFGGFFRHGLRLDRFLPAVLVFLATGTLVHYGSIYSGVVAWLPGRTASVMTVFCLIAMAAYARYERLGAARVVSEPTPLDPPATRTTQASEGLRQRPIWAVVAVLATALALGSYEQAVMLPATLVGVAVILRWQGFRPRWGWQAAFWGVLGGYLFLRYQLVPSDTSGYQKQQLRFGPGVLLTLTEYTLPFLGGLSGFRVQLETGIVMLLTAAPWIYVLETVSQVTAFYQARRRLALTAGGFGLAFLAFLPMAWLKPFDHYHYWPLAMRSLLIVGLFAVGLELLVSAWSPRGRSAPPRPAPAPGSLPRP